MSFYANQGIPFVLSSTCAGCTVSSSRGRPLFVLAKGHPVSAHHFRPSSSETLSKARLRLRSMTTDAQEVDSPSYKDNAPEVPGETGPTNPATKSTMPPRARSTRINPRVFGMRPGEKDVAYYTLFEEESDGSLEVRRNPDVSAEETPAPSGHRSARSTRASVDIPVNNQGEESSASMTTRSRTSARKKSASTSSGQQTFRSYYSSPRDPSGSDRRADSRGVSGGRIAKVLKGGKNAVLRQALKVGQTMAATCVTGRGFPGCEDPA